MKNLIENAYHLFKMQELAESGWNDMTDLLRDMERNAQYYTPADFERVQEQVDSMRKQMEQYKNSLQVVISKIKQS